MPTFKKKINRRKLPKPKERQSEQLIDLYGHSQTNSHFFKTYIFNSSLHISILPIYRQDNSGQDNSRQNYSRQDNSIQGNSSQNNSRQNNSRQNNSRRTNLDKTILDETILEKLILDKTILNNRPAWSHTYKVIFFRTNIFK